MKETIQFTDFAKLDIRVGRVVAASEPEWSQKLIELKVDFGPELGQRTILAGVKGYYSSAELEGNNYLFVVNLAERKMGQGVSQGMMLAADGSQPQLIPAPTEIEAGTIIS